MRIRKFDGSVVLKSKRDRFEINKNWINSEN